MPITIRLKKRTHRPRGTKYPIILAPGLFGFDRRVVSYFLGITKYINALGCNVTSITTETSPVNKRATLLKKQVEDFIRSTKARKVNIIAHSMGGLDARYAISHLGLDGKVASLTTIATPHHGTPAADWGTKRLTALARMMCTLFGCDPKTFHDLTTESCKRFNEKVKNIDGIRYFTYSGSKEKSRTSPLLWPLFDLIMKEAGENDGLVPVYSAKWQDGEDGVKYMGNYRADHLNLIGWRFDLEFVTNFDKRRFYRGIVENLKRNEL